MDGTWIGDAGAYPGTPADRLEQLMCLLGALLDGLLVCDDEGRMVHAGRLVAMSGYGADELEFWTPSPGAA